MAVVVLVGDKKEDTKFSRGEGMNDHDKGAHDKGTHDKEAHL